MVSSKRFNSYYANFDEFQGLKDINSVPPNGGRPAAIGLPGRTEGLGWGSAPAGDAPTSPYRIANKQDLRTVRQLGAALGSLEAEVASAKVGLAAGWAHCNRREEVLVTSTVLVPIDLCRGCDMFHLLKSYL